MTTSANFFLVGGLMIFERLVICPAGKGECDAESKLFLGWDPPRCSFPDPRDNFQGEGYLGPLLRDEGGSSRELYLPSINSRNILPKDSPQISDLEMRVTLGKLMARYFRRTTQCEHHGISRDLHQYTATRRLIGERWPHCFQRAGVSEELFVP